MESAWVDFRTGLDGALPDDGDGGLVGLETVRLGKGHGVFWSSAGFQCSLDTAVFLGEATGLGAGGHHRDVGGDFGDANIDHFLCLRQGLGCLGPPANTAAPRYEKATE